MMEYIITGGITNVIGGVVYGIRNLYGTVNVKGGTTYNLENNGELYVTAGTIRNTRYCEYALSNYNGTATISGGTIISDDECAVYGNEGITNITGNANIICNRRNR